MNWKSPLIEEYLNELASPFEVRESQSNLPYK